MGPRGGKARSTPPSDSKRRRIASARFSLDDVSSASAAQDVARLVLHRVIPIGGTQAQFALQGVVQAPDCNAGHVTLLQSMKSY
jgi:hypothetical protein